MIRVHEVVRKTYLRHIFSSSISLWYQVAALRASGDPSASHATSPLITLVHCAIIYIYGQADSAPRNICAYKNGLKSVRHHPAALSNRLKYTNVHTHASYQSPMCCMYLRVKFSNGFFIDPPLIFIGHLDNVIIGMLSRLRRVIDSSFRNLFVYNIEIEQTWPWIPFVRLQCSPDLLLNEISIGY